MSGSAPPLPQTRNATHTSPPTMCRDSSASGSNEKHKDHHHQQRKEQHRVQRILRAPLQPNVFHQRRERDRPKTHRPPSREVLSLDESTVRAGLAVRSTICPACIHTNSSAAPSSNTPDGSPQKSSCPHHACPSADQPSRARNAHPRSKTARRAAVLEDRANRPRQRHPLPHTLRILALPTIQLRSSPTERITLRTAHHQ